MIRLVVVNDYNHPFTVWNDLDELDFSSEVQRNQLITEIENMYEVLAESRNA